MCIPSQPQANLVIKHDNIKLDSCRSIKFQINILKFDAASILRNCYQLSLGSLPGTYVLSSFVIRTSTTPTNKPEVVESCHLVLHGCRSVSQLRRVVFIVACHDGDQSAIRNVPQRYHLDMSQGTNAYIRAAAGTRPCHWHDNWSKIKPMLHDTFWFPEKS